MVGDDLGTPPTGWGVVPVYSRESLTGSRFAGGSRVVLDRVVDA
jgi:hypothetical protein